MDDQWLTLINIKLTKKSFIRAYVSKWHRWLFKNTHLIGPAELETSDPTKRPIMKTLDNPVNFFLTSSNIISDHVFFIKILWISKI